MLFVVLFLIAVIRARFLQVFSTKKILRFLLTFFSKKLSGCVNVRAVVEKSGMC